MARVPAEPAFDVPALLARERGALMSSLHRLEPRDWERRTACPAWRVRDLVSHIWCTDLHVLSRLRDGYGPLDAGRGAEAPSRDAVTVAVNEHNERWVAATRGLSPRVLVDRLQESGPQVTTVFRVGDPGAPAEPVTWAGGGPQPLWFCGARELTERFVHQQQLRAAVGQVPFDDDEVVAAVVDTFSHAFPAALAGVTAPAGTTVAVAVEDATIRRRWTFTREERGWMGRNDTADDAAASLRTDPDAFWRLLSGNLSSAEQVQRVDLAGTPTLFAALRDTRAVLI